MNRTPAPREQYRPPTNEEMPEAAGLSIRARETVREDDNGTQVVENVFHLWGTELVTEPARPPGWSRASGTGPPPQIEERLRRRLFGEGYDEAKDEDRALAFRPLRDETLAEAHLRIFG